MRQAGEYPFSPAHAIETSRISALENVRIPLRRFLAKRVSTVGSVCDDHLSVHEHGHKHPVHEHK